MKASNFRPRKVFDLLITCFIGIYERGFEIRATFKYLFGKDETTAARVRGNKKKKQQQQQFLFKELDELEAEAKAVASELKPEAGETVLDRVHQSMILFSAGRGEALRRFLVDDGVGTDARFWKLAQALSALYPKDTDEKRWVDGVLARKKGLGL